MQQHQRKEKETDLNSFFSGWLLLLVASCRLFTKWRCYWKVSCSLLSLLFRARLSQVSLDVHVQCVITLNEHESKLSCQGDDSWTKNTKIKTEKNSDEIEWEIDFGVEDRNPICYCFQWYRVDIFAFDAMSLNKCLSYFILKTIWIPPGYTYAWIQSTFNVHSNANTFSKSMLEMQPSERKRWNDKRKKGEKKK